MPRLRVIQHNVLSWQNRKFDLCNTYRQFDPDIVLINSHGLTDETRLKIPGFRVYQVNSSGEGSDGVAIAVRSKLIHRIQDDFLTDILAVTIETPDGPLTIATTYLPPRRQYIPHPDFMRLLRRQTPVVVAGDLNARHPTLGYASTNQVGRDLIDYLRRQTARHLGPHFPTYYGPLSATAPDIVLTNNSFHMAHSIFPGPLTSSDHIPLILDISTSPILTQTYPYYAFRKANWDAFKEDDLLLMTNHPDPSHSSLEGIDDAVDAWMNTVKETADKHIPKRYYRLEPHPRPTRQTQITRVQFQALRDRATQVGWTYEDYRRYIRLRLTLQDLRKTEARNFWGRVLMDLSASHRDPRKFWGKVKRLSGRSTGPDSFLIDNDGQRHYTNKDKERLFTAKWTQVFQDDDDDNDFANNDIVFEFLRANGHRISPHAGADPSRLSGTSLLDSLISSEELKFAIRSSKSTCPGGSKINKTVLTHLPDCSLDRLRGIFNAALSAGYFPDRFKEAEMRMIVKSGKDPTRPDSYRPISLLEVPGKLFERVIAGRLRGHLEGRDLYSPGQYGFRRGRGTTHAIAIATETLAVHQASKNRCNVVLRDVSKAFDKVWQLGLKFKLLHLGLPDPAERILCDFMDDRLARVRIGRHVGRPFSLETGVPQGSVLSPTLYTIFTSDCPGSDAGVNVQYADDVSQIIFHPGRSKQFLNTRTGREIDRVSSFEAKWRIRTNMAKFTVIAPATRNPAQLLANDDPIDFRPSGSLLGLKISGTGYSSHVTSRVNKARTALATLYRFRELEPKIKLHLVRAMVLPVLTYPPIPLHALSKRAHSRLQKVQNAALRFAYGVRWDDYIRSVTLHEEADIPPVNVRLHQLAARVWQRMADENWEQYLALRDLHEAAPDRDHSWFPRSIRALENDPAPIPRYV